MKTTLGKVKINNITLVKEVLLFSEKLKYNSKTRFKNNNHNFQRHVTKLSDDYHTKIGSIILFENKKYISHIFVIKITLKRVQGSSNYLQHPM